MGPFREIIKLIKSATKMSLTLLVYIISLIRPRSLTQMAFC